MRLDIMGGLQKLGRSLMLPIAVLPVAGLLLRLGQPDLLDIAFIANAGDAIFANLALIFAIGLAVGFANDSNGAAGLAGVVGYLVLDAVLHTLNEDINMGVLSGIIIGTVAGLLYNRFKDINLPDYLAFFGGRRFIPIVTGLAAVILGMIFGVIWPTVQTGIDTLGQWLIDAGDLGLFVYGVLNRLLIVTGLHHVLNSFVWFVFGSFDGATGDLNRFFAGDPSAGSFMAGFFPVMMFGLPAAALAMYHAAPKGRRAQVGGLLLSLALTAFLTGVTEPIEFTFMFLAPFLYVLHALLTGLSLVLMNLLDVKLGFTFSAGAFDYALSYGLSTNGWLMIPVGLCYFALYYGVFRWAIVRFDLPTPGREPEAASTSAAPADLGERGPAFVHALGGAANMTSVGACTTRLRLVLVDDKAIDEPALKQLGARGVLHLRGGGLQVILGPIADGVADEIRAAMNAQGAAPSEAPAASEGNGSDAASVVRLSAEQLDHWLTALGGRGNVQEATAVAMTRLRLRLGDVASLDEATLKALGAQGIQRLDGGLVHVLLGERAPGVAASLGDR
ncbi:N-acetylglucosamine-specific PTS transporter subunit IIBC [Chromohalobacter canadensis]|uniref:N-acetylglucosamine-specific PTS transporter subunit IIBC n=1 Tax=Chromohalobacter canadensis TaxID=141389 RepID=UPI0021C0D7B6|nr:N-acetylglucosamine-specific PTS transporter subunit IIBC [Chromohalobacter canadensis]MCT8467682.1 N-acetylglucosamine-specific PTS transporter subunit IIBC [Chromohalobacter canadensis]MCT8470570.1 N-acetylglucosamine-specific PTS transporter subunit IIBC [Chromohalobacter canadensis]MCT8498179.1 N-acetylglucosamine-specific PTS transporter subunit IIBC [Chromohalobacter canadensis]